jgi:tetratricopeptide (TPR) repeat protein
MGRSTESIAEMRRALELEPLSLMINVELGDMLLYARINDQAIEQYRKTLDLDSSFVRAHIQLGQAYCQKAQYEEAISELKKAISLNREDNYAIQLLGYTYAISGRTSEAYKALEELKERAMRTHVLPYDLAMIYVGLGEKDQAFEWLEKAFAERDEGLLYLKVDPLLDSLRSDPRFAGLLRRLNLAP